MTSWSLPMLRECLSGLVVGQGEALVETWLAEGVETGDYAGAAQLCASFRRYDLAFRIYDAAWRGGSRSYDAAYAVEMLWREAADGRALAECAEAVANDIGAIAFRQEGDDFHLGATRSILAGLAGLALVEEGEAPGVLQPGRLHPFCVEALWRRVWICHNALQFPKAQALAREALRLLPIEGAETLHILSTFFGFHGGAGWALERLAGFGADSAVAAKAAALRVAIAFEAELADEFRSAVADLDCTGPESREPSEEMAIARASVSLHQALNALYRDDIEQCLEIAREGQERDHDHPWAPLFELPIGMAIEARDTAGAVAAYERALDATGDVRCPFPPYGAVDAAAAIGRWDVAYRYLERHAAEMRPLYRLPAADGPLIDTGRAESFPQRGVVLSGWGVGDGIIAYGLLRRHLPSANYAMAMDRRLLGLARRAREEGVYEPQTLVSQVGARQYFEERRGVPESVDALRCPAAVARLIQETGTVVLQEDLAALHVARRGQGTDDAVSPVFAADPKRVAHMRDWLKEAGRGRVCIGLGWRSGVRSRTRARTFLSEEQVARLMQGAPAAWVLMQYDWDADEIARIEKAAGTRFLICPDLDIKQDLEGVAALALACDLVMCTGVATRDLAAAVGARVFSLHYGRPNAEAWRRGEDSRDLIFPDMTHADPREGEAGVVAQAIDVARRLVSSRRGGWLHRLLHPFRNGRGPA